MRVSLVRFKVQVNTLYSKIACLKKIKKIAPQRRDLLFHLHVQTGVVLNFLSFISLTFSPWSTRSTLWIGPMLKIWLPVVRNGPMFFFLHECTQRTIQLNFPFGMTKAVVNRYVPICALQVLPYLSNIRINFLYSIVPNNRPFPIVNFLIFFQLPFCMFVVTF